MERVRKNFAKSPSIMEPPHLISMQRISYEKFLQIDVEPNEREDSGLQAIFKNVFPINDFNGHCSLEFVNYSFGEPKYTINECQQRGMTYDIPVKITVRLITFDVDEETEVQTIRDIKEQQVFLGALPLMTGDGVFVINGTERAIVSQLQRSPGLFFTHDNGKKHSSGKLLYSARIIPVRGSWIDLEYDIKDILHVRIDRRRKFPVTTLLKALDYENEVGEEPQYSSEKLLRKFYPTLKVKREKDSYYIEFNPETVQGQRLEFDLVDPQTGDILGKEGKKLGKALCKRLVKANVEFLRISEENLIGKFLVTDFVKPETGELLAGCNSEITESTLELFAEAGIDV